MSDILADALKRGAKRLAALGCYNDPVDLQNVGRGGEVLAALAHLDIVMQRVFLLTPNFRLGGEVPLVRLAAGGVDDVITAAQCFAEQGCD
jgi:hypothetical protein